MSDAKRMDRLLVNLFSMAGRAFPALLTTGFSGPANQRILRAVRAESTESRTAYPHSFPQDVVAREPMDTNSSKGPGAAQAAREQIFFGLGIRVLRRSPAQVLSGNRYAAEKPLKSKR
jgi:hypothetical protein